MSGFLLSCVIVFAITPLVIRYARMWGFVDDPKKRYHPAHTHEGIIPRAGGIAIYLGIVISAFFFLELSRPVIGILLGATLVVLVGILDDYRDLSPFFRLGTNIIAALFVVGFGGGIPYIANPLGGLIHLDLLRVSFEFFGEHSILIWSGLAAVIWIVWMMNAIGWSAGVDGQLPGFVVIACIVIAALANRFVGHDVSQRTVIALALITAGAFFGFTPWNYYPQKIMPGYGGKSLAGFMLATLAILSFVKVGTAILVLGVPFIDACYTVARRILTKSSPFLADRGHLHHRLLDLGWGKRRIALFYWAITAFLGVIALTTDSVMKLVILGFVTIFVIGTTFMARLIYFFSIVR